MMAMSIDNGDTSPAAASLFFRAPEDVSPQAASQTGYRPAPASSAAF